MSIFNASLDNPLSVWRKYKLRDCQNFILACMVFIAGCVLAIMSWKLGVSLIFILPYILLGTSGFIMYYFNMFKILPETTAETLPLLSYLRSNAATQKKIKERKAAKTVHYSMSPDMEVENSENGCNSDTTCVNQNPEPSSCTPTAIPKDGSDKSGSIIKCVESSYYPLVAQEFYATVPSPGGGQSRKAHDEGQANSWQRRFSPLTGLFRTSPAVPSSQFHISLTEVPLNEEESSQPRSTSCVQDETAEVQWMSSIPHEPIYQNIIPYPERRRIFTESGIFRELQYDIPSKELKTVEEGTSGMSVSGKQSAMGSLLVESSSRTSNTCGRKQRQVSRERTYVNVFPSSKESQKQSLSPLGRVKIPKRTEKFRKDSDGLPEEWFDPLSPVNADNIYVNVASKCHGVHTHSSRRERSKTHELWSIRDPGVPSATRKEHGDTSRVNTSTGNLKSDISDRFPVYQNISSLSQETKKQMTVESDRCNERLSKVVKQSADSTGCELTSPENMNVNYPLDAVNCSVRDKTSPTEAEEQANSENESSADTETDVSTSGEYPSGNKMEVNRQESNRGRSEYMYVTALGPTLKTYVKPGATGVRTFPSAALKHLSRKLVGDVGDSSTEELAVATKSRTLPIRDGTRACKSSYEEERSFPDRTCSRYVSPLCPLSERKQNVSQTWSLPASLSTRHHSSEATCPVSMKNESAERKHGYENLLYDTNISTVENTCIETEDVERSVIEEENDKISFSKEKPDVQNLSSFQKEVISDQDVTEVKRNLKSYETILYDESASSSRLEELGTNKTLPQMHEMQDIPSTKINAITTSEDEDSFCLLKSLSGGKATEKDTRLTVSESFTHSEGNYPSSFFEPAQAFPRRERDTHGSKNPEYIFLSTKQRTSSASRRMSPEIMDEQPLGRGPFNTPLEITNVKPYRAREGIMDNIKQPKLPRIFPPLDRSYSNSGSRLSIGNSPPTTHIDLPVILNRSTFVQSQLEKFTQNSSKLASISSVQLSTVQASTRSSSSSGVLLSSRAQVGSPNKSLPSASANRSSGFRPGFLLSSPTKTNLKRKPCELSFDTSLPQARAEMVTDQQTDFTVTTSHLSSSPSPGSDEFSEGKSAVLPRHSPVYF